MVGPVIPPPPPPPPPGGPRPPSQKTSDVLHRFRPTKVFRMSKADTCVTSIDFDDSGEYALAACNDDSLQLYSAREGKHLKELLSQKYGAHLARFTHHSSSIIYASTKVDDGIRYLSTHDNAFLRYFKGHTAAVTCLAMCPASDTFLSGAMDDTLRLWDLKSPMAQGRLNLLTPHLVAYDPSATVIAVASSSTHEVLLYDLRNYDRPPFATFDVRPFMNAAAIDSTVAEWTNLEFSNDGKSLLLASNSDDGHLILDAFEGTLRARCARNQPVSKPRPAPGNPGVLGSGDACFTSDGRYLVGGSGGERDVVAWDTHAQPTGQDKILKPWCAMPTKSKAAVMRWNPRYNMCAAADKEMIFFLPDEHVDLKPP